MLQLDEGELTQVMKERDELQKLLDKFERHMAEVHRSDSHIDTLQVISNFHNYFACCVVDSGKCEGANI